MDIAELGFSVDSSQIDVANAKLDKLTAAAVKVGTSSKNIKVGADSSGLDKMEEGASRALASLQKMIAATNAANQAFAKTREQILVMNSAFAELSAIEQSAARVIMQVADATKIVGNRVQEQLSVTGKQIQVLESANLLRSQGIITARQLANVEATVTAEIMDNASAVKRSSAAYSELIAAQNSAAASAKRVANANAAAIVAEARSQHATNAQRDFNGLLGVSGPNSSAQLAQMKRDAQAAFGAVETSGTGAMNKIAVSATKTTAEVGALRGAVMGLGNVFKHAFGGLIAFAAVGAIAEFSKSLGEAQVKMQQILFTLSAVSGGMANAKQEFQFVTDISMKLGLNLEESAAGFSRLAASAYGAGLSTADLHKGFTGLSEAFTVLHAPADEVRRVLIQLDQGFSLGKIQMRDLRAISNSMPNVMELVKESFEGTGKSMSSMLAQGGIPAEEFFQRFTALLHDKYGPAAVDAAQGINAELQRLHSTMTLLKTQSGFAEPFTEAIHDLVETLNQADVQTAIKGIVKGMGDGFKNIIGFVSLLIEHIGLLTKAIEALVIVITTRLIAGGLTKLGAAVAQQAALFGVYSIETRALSVSMTVASVSARGLSAAMALVGGPIGLAIIAIGAIGYAIYQSVTKVDRMRESFKALTDQMKDTSAIASSTADNLKTALGSFASTDPLTKTTGFKEAVQSAQEAQASMGQVIDQIGTYKTKLAGLIDDLAKLQKDRETATAWMSAKGIKFTFDTAEIIEAKKEIEALKNNISGLQGQVDSVNDATSQLANTFQSMLIPQLKEAYHEGSNTGGIMGGIESAWLKLVDTVNNNPLDMFAKAKGDLDKMEDDLISQAKDYGKTRVQKLRESIKAKNDAQKASGLPDNADAIARDQEALAAAAKLDAGLKKHITTLSAYQKLVQSIKEKMDAQTLLNAEMKASGGNVDKLTEGQKLLIKFNTELATTYKGTSAAMAEQMRTQINGLIAQEKATQAVKDNYEALKKQAEALKAVNSVGSHAQAKADAIGGQAASLVPGSVAGKERGVSEAAGLKATLADQAKLLGNTKEAAAAYAAASTSVDQYAKALNDLAVAQKAASAVEQFDDSRSPYAQQERAIAAVQSHIGYLQKLQAANSKAFDPKILAGYQKALAGMKQQLLGIKLEGAANNVATGLKSLQSLAKEGSKDYEAMQVAIDAANVAAAIGAILNQGMGDPYTAFARMAAMAVAVATLVGDMASFGDRHPDTAAERQASQGTGSVLGDATAKSDSIAKATDITANATQKLVGINTGMLTALQSLQQALGAAGNQLAQGAGNAQFPGFSSGNVLNNLISTFDPLGGDPITKALNSFLFGGSKKVVDQGIVIAGGALQNMINGIVVGAYQTVHTSGGLFTSGKAKDSISSVSDDFNKQFQLVISSIADTVKAGATALGLLPANIQAAMGAFKIAETHISLKGLSAEDQQKAIEAVFSKIFDDLAGAVVPFVGQFQKVGEGLGETLVRVATDVQVMQEAVKQLGISVSAAGPEAFAQASVGLAELMGGVNNLADSMTSFVGKFAPDAHKFKVAQDAITSALGQVGLVLPPTRDAMWALMQTLDASIPGDQKKIAALLQLTDTSDAYYTMLEDANNKLAASAQDLATKLYGTIGTTLDALTAKLNELKTSTQSALGTALGSNSPLSAKDQLDLALKGLHSGLTTVDQVLSLGKKLYRGADYTKLYQQVMAGQGMGTGSAADVGAQVDQYNALYAQQQSMKAAQDAVSRFNDAKTLAGYVEQMSVNTGKSYSDVAGGLGFNLADLGKDLGVGSITGYLDSLKLNGLSQGESLANISAGTNEQVTLLKSIDQRLSAIESGTSATAANTGKAATQTTASGLKSVASTTRKASV